jgi:hypothetical protein
VTDFRVKSRSSGSDSEAVRVALAARGAPGQGRRMRALLPVLHPRIRAVECGRRPRRCQCFILESGPSNAGAAASASSSGTGSSTSTAGAAAARRPLAHPGGGRAPPHGADGAARDASRGPLQVWPRQDPGSRLPVTVRLGPWHRDRRSRRLSLAGACGGRGCRRPSTSS